MILNNLKSKGAGESARPFYNQLESGETMYNYLLFRWLCFRNCDAETKEDEIMLTSIISLSCRIGKDKKQKGRLKCECFCNGHCAFDCPNAQIDYFESKYDLPADEIGLSKIKCRECLYYDRYMTCNDCYFQYSKECRFTNNFERGVKYGKA